MAYAAITFPMSIPATLFAHTSLDYFFARSKIAQKCSTLLVVVSFCRVGFGSFFDKSSNSPFLDLSSLTCGLPFAALSCLLLGFIMLQHCLALLCSTSCTQASDELSELICLSTPLPVSIAVTQSNE